MPSTKHPQWVEPHIHVDTAIPYHPFLPHLRNITYHHFAPQLKPAADPQPRYEVDFTTVQFLFTCIPDIATNSFTKLGKSSKSYSQSSLPSTYAVFSIMLKFSYLSPKSSIFTSCCLLGILLSHYWSHPIMVSKNWGFGSDIWLKIQPYAYCNRCGCFEDHSINSHTSCFICCCSLLIVSSALVSSTSFFASCCLNICFSLSLNWSCCFSPATSWTGKRDAFILQYTIIKAKLQNWETGCREGGILEESPYMHNMCIYQLSHLLLLSPDGLLCHSQLSFLRHKMLSQY